MREQVSDEVIGLLRPKPAHLDEAPTAWPGRAAAAGRPDVLGADGVLGLQRSVGNAGVTAMLEADDEVAVDHTGHEHAGQDHTGQDQAEQPSPVHEVIGSGGGRPLDPGVRGEMEARLGQDFSDVRVHDDDRASASASAVNAHAYTVGSNIVFQRDHADISSTAGKTTLAHELTHVVQQRSGPVEGTSAPGGIRISDPSDRQETEAAANAERVMAGPAPGVGAAVSAAGPALQREVGEEEPEEEPEVQGLFVQREDAEEDEEQSPPV